MRHRIPAAVAGIALSVGALGALPAVADAAPSAPAHSTAGRADRPTIRGLRCAAAGVETLADLGLLGKAALGEVDYSQFADPENGPIFTTLPAGSYLSLRQVIQLHLTNPDLFAWCR
jgi:hypothetical protein